jgi:hypothetical protein
MSLTEEKEDIDMTDTTSPTEPSNATSTQSPPEEGEHRSGLETRNRNSSRGSRGRGRHNDRDRRKRGYRRGRDSQRAMRGVASTYRPNYRQSPEHPQFCRRERSRERRRRDDHYDERRADYYERGFETRQSPRPVTPGHTHPVEWDRRPT